MLTRLLRLPARYVTHPLGRALSVVGLSPNAVTVIGMILVGVGSALVVKGLVVLGGGVVLVGAAFDALDGAVARAAGKITVAGKFLDSTLDRLSDALMMGAVIWLFVSEGSEAYASLAFAALVLGFLTSYIRARAEGLGFSCDVGIAERTERVLLVGAGLVLGLVRYAIIILVVMSAVTVIQRFVHVWKQAKSSSS